ncbi:MAG: GGDEF domain-containing protein [Thiomicrorhabdus chilensis]|uniref:GGDEF domain-containing protein n=1 Tax=Thiomicrorhabdus chilensis TaxID=63656 RepID=UPI0004133AB8|nr:GGDEF domain-containing protein [Thiomicrorhabdus chilensis]MDX1347479.1 GGDEF domain-containing protein [Thiomicrorhabdus chilensis]
MARHYFWLLLLSGFAVWQAYQIPSWPLGWQALLDYAPYAVAAIGVFVSLLLNRMQPVFLLVNLLLVVFLMSDLVPLPLNSTAQALRFPLVSLLIPINILLWILLPERGVKHHAYNLFLTGLLVLQGVGIYWMMQNLSFETVQFLAKPVSTDLDSPFKMPMLSTVVMLVVANLMIIRLAMMRKARVLDQVALFVLILVAVGLNNAAQYGLLNWLITIAALMIVLSVVFDTHQIAYTDELTGMAGRRALFESFMGLGRRYSIAMIDIDHFKKFNDTYGHDIGDLVLRTVSKVLNQVGSGGKAYRFGGEEFTVVFTNKTPEQARPILDELRKQVEATDLRFKHKNQDTSTKVTVSIGVAEKTADIKSPEEVVKAADQALYQAKEMGRNRVVVSGDPAEKVIKRGQKSARIRKRKS